MSNLQVKAFCLEYLRAHAYDSLMCMSHLNGLKFTTLRLIKFKCRNYHILWIYATRVKISV